MNKEQYFEIIREKIGSIYSELLFITETIKADFEIERKQDPGLTMKVIDYHLDIVKRFALRYNYPPDESWSLEKNIQSVSRSISSFYREFDNPFLGSERWYQRIKQLLSQLGDEANELDRLLEMNDEGEIC